MRANAEMRSLADRLCALLGLGRVAQVQAVPLSQGEEGFSGAAMHRLLVVLEDGRQTSFICKKADLKERMVMKVLTERGRGHTPAACSEDCTTDAPMWMIQQDLGRRGCAPHDSPQWMARVAGALADIHSDHFDSADAMPWLPHADAAYWQAITTRISADHWERMARENDAFAREFGPLLPRLRRVGERFASDMTALYQEKEWLTLTHGDLQSIDGDHVYNLNGRPCFIDFGFARYAPFYIDLVDYFSLEEARVCHQALQQRGFPMRWRDFEERFRAARPYPGFIYLYSSLMQWQRGSKERLMRLMDRLLS